MSNSKIIDTMITTAKELGLGAVTIKEIEALDLKEVKPLPPTQIKKCDCVKNLAKL